MIKQALILAAGFGTRLKPWTVFYPKPLMTIYNKPIIAWHIDNLLQHNITHIYINGHHLSHKLESIARYYFDKHPLAKHAKLTFIHENSILGTGGALYNLKKLILHDDLLIVNSDIIFSFNLKSFYNYHKSKKSIATMLIRPTDNAKLKQVFINKKNEIVKIADYIFQNSIIKDNLAFTGIHLINHSLLKYVISDQFACIIRDVYQNATQNNHIIHTFKTEKYWLDIGDVNSYKQVHIDLLNKKIII